MDDKKRAKLGRRWVCFSCEGKFYDLNKPEPVCPKCGSNQLESPLVKKVTKKRKKTTRKKKAKKKREPAVRTLDDEDKTPADEGVDFESLDLGGSDQIGSVQVEED